MVSLPHVSRNTLHPKYEKPLYYFKDVKLEKSGFKFDRVVEFEVNDALPLTTNTYAKDKKVAAMNDLFFVFMSNNKEIATIILRKNVSYTEGCREVSSCIVQPSLVSEDEFENIEEPKDCSKFYRFCKLVENESVRIRFDSDVNKILLNGDQIIFMLVDRIVIYTLFSTSTIEVKALDIAVSRNLYILTENSILIYGDRLLKKIKLDKKCRFVVPTPSHIFVIRRAIVYKITDSVAEPYFDALSFIDECVFDDRFMYLASDYGLFKVGLYDKEIYRIQHAVWSLKLHLCDSHIVLFNSNSGLLFIDKNDFSRFSARNLNISLCSIATYRNTIAYVCSEEVIFCEYANIGGNLELANPPPDESMKTGIKSAEEARRVASECLAPSPYRLYGMNAFGRKSGVFTRLQRFRSNPEVLKTIKAYEDSAIYSQKLDGDISPVHIRANSISSLLPSPALTQTQFGYQAGCEAGNTPQKGSRRVLDAESAVNPYTALFAPDERFVEDVQLTVAKSESNVSEDDLAKVKREVKRVYRYLQKQLHAVEESSSVSEEDGLFFDERECQGLETITHPVLQSIPEAFKSKKQHKNTEKIPLHKVFKRVYSKLGLNNPATYSTPLEAVVRGSMRVIVYSKRQIAYPKSYFFIENHIDYFKRRFRPRNNEDERPYRGIIYSFIDDEFKKILGHKQVTQSRTGQKADMRKKKGGF